MSNEKDKLIELLKDTLHEWECDVSTETITQIAEHLLENGVIVLPCKVGDVVYYPWMYNGQCDIAFNEVESIKIYYNRLPIVIVKDWESDMPMPISFTIEDFGKTVFLTIEEAEQVLKEYKNND